MFIVKFDTDNAAFEEDPGTEIRYILWKIANGPIDPNAIKNIKDINGNTVGYWYYTEEDYT